MEKVKALIAAGLDIPVAIRQSLGMLLFEFADKYGFPRPVISDVLNGNRKATDAHVSALIAELGGSECEWQELLWAAGLPEHIPWRDALRWMAASRAEPSPSVRVSA